jgi:hypothetical protein
MRGRGELEEGERADMWGRLGSAWEREEGEFGRASFVGHKRRWAGGKERERRRWAAGFWAKREGVKGLGSFLFLFLTLFKLTSQIINSLKVFKIKIILKTFRTSHNQIIKPCNQKMMHKHLLLLNY